VPRLANNPDPRRAYQRERILAALQVELLTAQQLADKLFLSRSGVQWYLKAMMKESPRLVRIAGYAPSPVRQRSAPMYGLGAEPDEQHIKSRAPKGHITVADRHAQILAVMGARWMTAKEVVAELGVQRARLYVFQLHDAGRLHIVAWRQHPKGGYPAPVYAVGAREDAPRPAAQSEHEKCARYWAKLKADPHRHGHYLQRNRMRKQPQTWLSALMG
jgi:hypothetical protein